MQFNNAGGLNNTSYTILAVAARSFNNGAGALGWKPTAPAANFFLGSYAYGGGEIGTGLALGYNNTSSDAQGNYSLSQYGPTLNGGTPAASGSGNSKGPETAEVITAELNTAVGQSISVNGTTVASNANTTPIASSSGANYVSYLGTGNALPDEGFFNGDLGEVVIFNRA